MRFCFPWHVSIVVELQQFIGSSINCKQFKAVLHGSTCNTGFSRNIHFSTQTARCQHTCKETKWFYPALSTKNWFWQKWTKERERNVWARTWIRRRQEKRVSNRRCACYTHRLAAENPWFLRWKRLKSDQQLATCCRVKFSAKNRLRHYVTWQRFFVQRRSSKNRRCKLARVTPPFYYELSEMADNF